MKSIRIVNTKRYWKLIPDKPCQRKSKYGLCKCPRDDIPTIVAELWIPKSGVVGSLITEWLWYRKGMEFMFDKYLPVSFRCAKKIWHEYCWREYCQ